MRIAFRRNPPPRKKKKRVFSLSLPPSATKIKLCIQNVNFGFFFSPLLPPENTACGVGFSSSAAATKHLIRFFFCFSNSVYEEKKRGGGKTRNKIHLLHGSAVNSTKRGREKEGKAADVYESHLGQRIAAKKGVSEKRRERSEIEEEP